MAHTNYSSNSIHTPANDANHSTIEASSHTKLSDWSSIFGDSDCGEPLPEQYLRIDFTPDKEIDNEFAQKKCCDFWSFVNSLPQIRNFMVYPEEYSIVSSETSLDSKENESSSQESIKIPEKTAVSVLELAQEKGYIDRTFEAKMPRSTCTLGSREYKDFADPNKYERKMHDPCCNRPTCKGLQICSDGTESPATLRALNKIMEDWDTEHPKSMEPPAHAPTLQHCIFQTAYYSKSS